MDKSFNDQELSDIMKEIEALEEDFKTEEEVDVETSAVIEELAQMEEDVAIPTPTANETKVFPMTTPSAPKIKSSNAATTMSFKVSGELNLELQFDVGGKIVSLEVNEAGLNIIMEGGMTFSIPLNESSSIKKSA